MIGFSGHNMAQSIMMQTSPMMQTMQYVDDYRTGRLIEPIIGKRLDWEYESRKLDFTPTFKPFERDPIIFQARLEEQFHSEKLFRGLELISTDKKPSSAFDFDSVHLAEHTFGISRQKDSSEIMLSYLESKPKIEAIYPAFDLGPKLIDTDYLRNVLDIDVPKLKPSLPMGFAGWARDTLGIDADYKFQARNMHEAVTARNMFGIDTIERFKPEVITIPTHVPWAKTIVDTNYRAFTGDTEYARLRPEKMVFDFNKFAPEPFEYKFEPKRREPVYRPEPAVDYSKLLPKPEPFRIQEPIDTSRFLPKSFRTPEPANYLDLKPKIEYKPLYNAREILNESVHDIFESKRKLNINNLLNPEPIPFLRKRNRQEEIADMISKIFEKK